MKYRVHTVSGTIYIIDNDKLEFERRSLTPLVGSNRSKGLLEARVQIIMGRGMILSIVPNQAEPKTDTIWTTEVISAERID